MTGLFGQLRMHVGKYAVARPVGGERAFSNSARAELSQDGRLGVVWEQGMLTVWQNARRDLDAEITDEATWSLDSYGMGRPIARACFLESEGVIFVVADFVDGTSAAVYVDEPFSSPPAWIPDLANLTGKVRALNGALQAVPNYMNGPKRAEVMQAIRQDASVGARLLYRHFELEDCGPLPEILEPSN